MVFIELKGSITMLLIYLAIVCVVSGVENLVEERAKPKCGYNEVKVPCRQICPPQNCEIAYTDYACGDETKICEPGCNCLPDYFRNGSGICIPNDKCPYPSTPVCGVNEIARDCRRICPPQTCISKYALFRCKEDIPCEPGCDCISNYLRDINGICIPSDKCPPLCSVPDECKRTCMTPNPPNCDYRDPPKSNIDGCECKQGYILSKEDGVCIKIEECPNDLGCNGDPHARTTLCPHPCPSTCEAPNATPCKRMCDPIGCACEDNYILSNITGKCILPDKCPGGNPCGKTGRFVSCKVNCPNDYCPVDDSRDIVLCDPPKNCLSGCICNLNHKRKSYKDPQCIVSSDCPPVCCTRPDEVWDSCPSACLAENCEDVNNQPSTCNTLVLNCEPRCICKKDYFRNASGICIPAKKCQPPTPVCGENEIARDCRRICPPQTCLSKYALFKCKEDIPCEPGCDCIPDYLRNENGVCIPSEKCPPLCSVPDECKRTCMTPKPPNCDYRDPPKSNIDGCECKQGYILSKKDGVCIKIEECPNDLGCNGDPHARTTLCPHPCPSTCDAPNATPCKRMCDPIGCACEDNYMLSNITGKCILPDKCPGGNPCGKSGRFVSCKVNCPNDYCPVDDSRDIVLCDPPKNCLSGCICKLNHKRKSYKDPQCIVSSDCPPVCCTRPDEVWDSCPSPCLAENCEDVNNQPTACNTLIAPTCEPRCICKKNYFRNATGICIPAKKCPC